MGLLTLTRLCAGIITVPVRLEPKIKQVNIQQKKISSSLIGQQLFSMRV